MSMTSIKQILKRKAFINGKIYTATEKNYFVQAVVTEGDRIIYAGTNVKAKQLIDSRTETIDLNGRLMLPGFIDAHTHFIEGGFYLLGLDLRPAESVNEFISIIKDYVAINKGKWITGGNWNHENWSNQKLPSKDLIDPYTGNTPVFIERLDKHMALANSLALKLAGITKDTQSPPGGLIEKDPVTGEPTGILKDSAMPLIYSIIPEHTGGELKKAAETALNEAKRNGVTGIHDISLPVHLGIYQNLLIQKKLTCRIYSRLPIKTYNNLIGAGIQKGFGSDKLSTGSLKAFADGSLGAGTAWFFDPYTDDSSNYGLPTEDLLNGYLEQSFWEIDKNNLQISVHAIGDKTNSSVLDIFEKIVKTNKQWDRRFRIEHAQHVKKKDIKRFFKYGVIASMQPYHLIDDALYAERKIGKRRLKEAYQFKTFLDEGVNMSFGSDWPVAPLQPLKGIYAAVTRSVKNKNYHAGFIPEQKISVEDAIRCYTINNAFASFEEEIKGSIETGKLADFVVLDNNILTARHELINETKVVMTVFDGEIIYGE